MSAVSPLANIASRPLYPRKRTRIAPVRMSAMGHKQTNGSAAKYSPNGQTAFLA